MAKVERYLRQTFANHSIRVVARPKKTGSAEVAGQAKPDSWFTAYRGDVAAAAWVPGAGHGRDAAGPIVRAVIQSGAVRVRGCPP